WAPDTRATPNRNCALMAVPTRVSAIRTPVRYSLAEEWTCVAFVVSAFEQSSATSIRAPVTFPLQRRGRASITWSFLEVSSFAFRLVTLSRLTGATIGNAQRYEESPTGIVCDVTAFGRSSDRDDGHHGAASLGSRGGC